MPYDGEDKVAFKAASREYYYFACVFVKSLFEGVNVHDPFLVVVDFAEEKKLTLDDWKNDFNSEHAYRDLRELKELREPREPRELKEAAVKCWKEDTALFYACVESVTNCTIPKENDKRLDSLKMVIDTMCDLLDDKNDKIREDIRTNLRKGIGPKLEKLLLKKRGIVNVTKQQHELTIEDCFNEKKLFDLLKEVSFSLDSRFRRENQPTNNVPDFPYVDRFSERGDAYPLFEKKNGKITFDGKKSNGLIAEQDGQSLVVTDSKNCKVIQEIGSDVCCVHYKSYAVKHKLSVFRVCFGKSAVVSGHRIYIKVGPLEFVSPECFFVMQKCPDLYAMAKDVYEVKERI
jgi:hypothetical protein